MDLCLACCCSWCFQPIPKIKRWTWCRVPPSRFADLVPTMIGVHQRRVWEGRLMHIIPYLQPTMQGIMSSHCSWLYSYHGSLQKLQTQCQNQQVLQWTRSIRLATSETLLLSPRVSTNEQSNMQGSKLYTSLKKTTVNDPTTQRISRLAPSEPGLWDPEFSLQKQRSWWNSIGPGRSFQHFATSSNWWLDPHPPRCDETTSHLAHKNGETLPDLPEREPFP